MPAQPTVIFDFDGTLALGRGPLRAYVACVREESAAGSQAAPRCLAAVAQFDTGASAYRDAYDAVRQAALDAGVSEAELSRAYLRSRDLLGTEAAPVRGPEGLAGFVGELSTHATAVLATNAPPAGVERALQALGVSRALRERHHSIGKPAGLTPIVAAHLSRGPVLAVGDIWELDLAPAADLGADTALVGVSSPAGATPTLRGATLTDLRDHIISWALAHTTTPTPR